jgi:two-component system response regulator
MPTPPADILLVEDNDCDAELALRVLRRHARAPHVHHVRDGVEAVDYLHGPAAHGHARPRVVLLDLKLPRSDGFDVLRRLRADERTRALPIVILTSSREEGDVTAAYRLGANSYIVKPVDFELFAEVVGQLGAYWLLLNEQPG